MGDMVIALEYLSADGWQEQHRGLLSQLPWTWVQLLGADGLAATQALQIGEQHEHYRRVQDSHRLLRATRLDGVALSPGQPADFTFHYHPSWNKVLGRCGVALRPRASGEMVVILTEQPDNPGASIINAAETIATALCQQYQLDPNRTLWVEHQADRNQANRPRDPSLDEYYDQMTFQWTRGANGWQAAEVVWSHHPGTAWLEELLGHPLPKGES